MACPCGLPLSAPRGQGGLPPTTVIRCTRGESAARVYAGVCMRAHALDGGVTYIRGLVACFVYSRRHRWQTVGYEGTVADASCVFGKNSHHFDINFFSPFRKFFKFSFASEIAAVGVFLRTMRMRKVVVELISCPFILDYSILEC